MRRTHSFTVDELRAAGALDVPPGWRKSLSAGKPKPNVPRQRDLFSGLADDDPLPEKQELPEEQEPTPAEPDGDE